MGGIFIPWLTDASRLTGYPVIEVPGHRTRGNNGGMRALECVTGHHTADGPGEYPSLFIVRDGRADLRGSLAHLGLGRSGAVYVIAAGLCYHAGASAWAGFFDLNDESIGIEAESVGVRDDWTEEQRDCYPRLVASLLYFMRRDASRFAGHREVCLPKGRKIDPAFIDLNAFRDRVRWLLADPLIRIPRFSTPTIPAVATRQRSLTEDQTMRVETPWPTDPETAKRDWEARWVSYGVDPPKGWGGTGIVKLTFSAPGGWVHDCKWWRRRTPNANVGVPNEPHEPITAAIPGGAEQFQGLQREMFIPERCDELELLVSAPGGVHFSAYYEH
jgi:hypothetical protein